MESIGHTSLVHFCPEMADNHISEMEKDVWVYVFSGFTVRAVKMDFGLEKPLENYSISQGLNFLILKQIHEDNSTYLREPCNRVGLECQWKKT